MIQDNAIVATSTGRGGAISIIRLSGEKSIEICDKFFVARNNKLLSDARGFTLHYGDILKDGELIDDVLVSVFRNPHSYTGENMVEISCHDSQYIKSTIISLAISNGASAALPGDFTMRAYANGKMDLVQAEAVADIIVSTNQSNHRLALNQMRGGYTQEFSNLRKELINIMSLLELELDFSEEDVEFADRTRLLDLVTKTLNRVVQLVESFRQGNVIKNGVPVAIVGNPNVGKSTLLNRLLNEDRAMVSSIAGTTRDVIEECITIADTQFRFIDTAGIRKTDDVLENMGIERTLQSIEKAALILLVVAPESTQQDIDKQLSEISINEWQNLIIVVNKSDISTPQDISTPFQTVSISAKQNKGIEQLVSIITSLYSTKIGENDVIITNARHFEQLSLAKTSLERVIEGIATEIPSDFLAQDLRESLNFIGLLTSEISNDDVLHNIFKNFCIGK